MFAHALAPFVSRPEALDVVRYTDTYTLVRDKYPKARVHLLLLPRDRARTTLHPFDALCAHFDPAASQFYAATRQAVDECVAAAVALLGPGAAARDFKVGVHARPSMANLHIHIISRDLVSDCLRTAKHYNSFMTPFFVEFDELAALTPQDRLTDRAYCESLLRSDLVCWCGRSFGRQLKRLKEHLAGHVDEITH